MGATGEATTVLGMASGAEQSDAERPGALIVGASSGIGAALAHRLARAGYRVALVARRQDALDALVAELNAGTPQSPVAFAFAHDVTAYEEAPAVFARAIEAVAPLRLVVFAAGIMPRTTTGASFATERAIIETNVVGALRWLSLAADALAARRGGALVAISSVAGDRGRPGNGAYMASKAALSSYLDSLRYRLAPLGVRVLTVKPGYVATPLVAGLKLPRRLTISADEAARRILRASQHVSGVVYVPGYWRAILWVVRQMPAALVARLPG